MKVLLDLNVLLDVVQAREPFYAASARVMSQVVRGEIQGYLAGHAITTLYYIVTRYTSRQQAEELIDWLLRTVSVAAQGRGEFLRARALEIHDFEDAATASAAEAAGCEVIVTRNLQDFAGSPVTAVAPEELLSPEPPRPSPAA